MRHFYEQHPWAVTGMALVGVATGCFLTFVLIVEDFLHQHEQHSDGFVFIELLCDFVLCTHVAITSLYYGPAYFTNSWRLAEPVIAFLCITSLYVYEATSRAQEGRVPHETIFALDLFRDIVRIARLVLFSRILMRTLKKYRTMTELGPGGDPSAVGADSIDTTEAGVQMGQIGQMSRHVVSLPSIQVTTRRVNNTSLEQKYDEIPGTVIPENTIAMDGKILARKKKGKKGKKKGAGPEDSSLETKARVTDDRTTAAGESTSESDGDESY